MRAFTQAAALLLVQSVVGESMPAPVRRVSATETIPTAYITLDVAVDGAETQVVPLRLDLVEAEEPCSPAQFSVNGQRLAQDAHGFGQGSLTLDEGITITSNWTFACQSSLKQALTVHVHTVNGSSVAGPASFTANFYQTTPVQIASVDDAATVRYLHLHTTVTESLADSGEEHSDVGGDDGGIASLTSGSFKDEVSRLRELRTQARELAARIRDQEAAVMDRLDRKLRAQLAREPVPTPLAECRDVRCAFKALAYRFRHSHEEVCESASGWRAAFGCAPREPLWEEEEDDVAGMGYADDLEWLDDDDGSWESEYISYEEEMMAAQYESTRTRMLLLVAESAIIFGSAVFLITAFLRRLTTGRRLRLRRRRGPSELPIYRDDARYFDEPKTLISLGFVGDNDHDERDGGPRKAGRQHRQGDDDEKAILRAADEKAAAAARETSTVADDFAELRAAAAVVSDLVAVDAAQRRTGGDYDDEAPPAYERVDEREHSL
ncbi:hypothetical protein V2A60_003061 [Cordyceps javanica]|uniref:Uncharacterized protein n=1 Tax=Cordyceps javanica TaxID=43265 RepID=A0A545W1H7_9HYPO|nr:hypothetical protein IF1G_05134 [Cordyceps javanica]TQW07831.1 hypothetical protein IF2G_04992 [Cordyceps javanica]